jgi:hypothetical protein
VKNLTITLPEELSRKAKIFAAERNTSVSKYVGELLGERLRAESGYQLAMERWQHRQPSVLNASHSPYPQRKDLYDR